TTLLTEWRDELQAWLKFHPWPWDHKTAEEYERRFVDGPEKWLDRGLGECHLRNQRLAVIVRDALRHFDRERYWLDAFVVMPKHSAFPIGSSRLRVAFRKRRFVHNESRKTSPRPIA